MAIIAGAHSTYDEAIGTAGNAGKIKPVALDKIAERYANGEYATVTA